MSQGLCESDVEKTALDIFRDLEYEVLYGYEVAPGEQRIPCRQPVHHSGREKPPKA